MPPKKKATEPTKKTVEKQKQKVIEDKTFGLKNKKGAKQQKFIKTVTSQVQHGNKSSKQLEKEKQEKLSKKDQKKKELEELNALLKPVQTLGKGVDPKSVLCAFFKQGQCSKGDKCKFSHDLNISRKGEKRSIYSDVRGEEETMDDWDEAKLEEVVSKKHGESNKAKTTTSIICKYFLEAVENSKYGWFWQCPNGDGCKYRHALPPGFVLKKDKKKEEKEDQISMEELVERERAALGDNLTKVTLETFLQWKERKRKEKIQAAKAASDKKKSDFKQGKMLGISGREMFTYNPDLVAGDDEEADDVVYTREPENDENGEEGQDHIREINLDELAAQAQEAGDKDITVAPSDRRKQQQNDQALQNGIIDDDDSNKLGMAAALPNPSKDTDVAIDGDVLAGDTPIDENLFDGEDLDLVEDELETLELDD